MKCKQSMAKVRSPAAEVIYHAVDSGSWIKTDYCSSSNALMHASLKTDVFFSAVGAEAPGYKL